MTKLLTLIFLLSTFVAEYSQAQSYSMNGTPINDCTGTFYDSGGNAGNYTNNENLTTTICSDGSSGTHIQLNFSGTDLAPGDALCFYDGQNAAAPLLSCAGDYTPGEPFIVQATAVNPSGCLTVEFISNGSGTATGWSAVINCVASCQQVLADLVSTNPAVVPADTGWIDVCPGERIFFNGKGLYPQNGFAYAQSDLTTSFEWNFGDGDISYGPNTSHRFDNPGGYYVQLALTDAQGCHSTNLINQRIRVASRPHFDLSTINDVICAGDTIHLSAAVDSVNGKTLVVTPNTSAFAVEGSRSDSLALPDGTGIPYQTSIYFTEFSPGQVLTNPLDLESICVNMEHSWLRDMEISLTCPNGQSIVLHNFGGQTGGQVFLGIPNDNDGFNPVPGSGWDYCWTPTATNGTWLQYANSVLGGSGTLPSGNYTPFDPISDLVGCPLNGEWTITVTDLWPIDNGYIFSWSLKFKDALYPSIETFTPQFTSWNWNNHPSIFYSSPDSIAAAPQNAGSAGYIFTVNDDFGCSWDTLVNIAVLPFTHPSCYSCAMDFVSLRDSSVCAGQPVALNASPLTPATQEVRFESYPDYKLGYANHPPSNPYPAPISINSVGYNLLSNPIAQITSVCMDIESDFDADLNVYLRAPDGKQLELSTGNGGSGDNYKITCFTPSATTPVIGSAAPFNGTYKPEGAWSSLNNALVNGDWKLMISDGFGPTQFGKVKWWSIGFNFTDNITYSWTNAASLSCNNCPTPVATPSATTSYVLTATNSFNCQYKDTVTLAVNAFFPAPANLHASSNGNGGMTWFWDAVPGATGYEISINGGPWMTPNGGLSQNITGLNSGDVVDIQVRALGGSPNCPPDITTGSSAYVVCTLEGILNSTTPAVCNGTPTGSAFISISNANPPVQVFPDGLPPAFPNGDLVNVFSAGNHFAILVDAMGCMDTVSFTISEPSPLTLTTTVNKVLCHGGNTGSATAAAIGGTGTITYSWLKCAGGSPMSGPTISNLFAGCYAVTATDANGCTANTNVTVTEPPAFQFTSMQDSVNCFGGSDGSATINVTGGTPPYTYNWLGNGSTLPTASGLNANFHTVAVLDSNLCQAITLVQVLQPPLLVIDSLTAKAVSCFGGNNGTATVFVHANSGTSPYSYVWSDMQTTKQAQGLIAGPYTVTVSDYHGCTASGTTTVVTPPELIASVSNINAEKCFGDCTGTATLQATGGTGTLNYLWSNPNVPAGTQASTTLCPGAYTVTVQDSKGCTDTGQFSIGAAAEITVQFTETPPACNGQLTGSVQTMITGGATPFQYNWSNGATTPNLANVNCGKYVLTLTDGAGCTKVDTATLVCPEVVQISGIVPEATRCFGEANGQITVTALGGSGTLTYAWSDPAGQTTATAINLPAGIYTVTVTDINGCSNSATAGVTQPTALTVSFAKTDITCFGGNDGSLTATAAGGNGGYQYSWNNMQTGPQISGLSASAYTVIVTDSEGCTQSGTSPAISQPATPVSIAIVQTKLSCYGQSESEALATATGGNGAPYTYVWSNNETTPNASNLGVGVYTVVARDAKGCSATQSIEIAQLDSIKVIAFYTPTTCYGVNDGSAGINYVSGGAGGGDTLLYNYQWSVPNSPDATSIGNLAGGQTYFLTVTDLQGCTGVFSFSIPPALQIQIQTDRENVSCFGFNDGTAEVTSVQNAVGQVTYAWSGGGSTPQISNLSVGIYTVTVQDTKGCTSTTTVDVKQPTLLSAAFNVTQLRCTSDQDAVIETVVSGGTPDYTLLWNTGASTATISNLAPGTYTLNITDKNGCTLSSSVDITQPDSMTFVTENIEPKCFGDFNGRLKIIATGGKLPYRYSLDGGTFGGSSTFIGLTAGIYTIQVRDANGCISSGIDTIDQPLPVDVSAGPDTTIILGQSVTLSPDVFNAFGLLHYQWHSALVEDYMCVDTPLCSEIIVSPTTTNTYRIQIVDANGCKGEAIVKVIVDKPRGIYVPTGFSPDGNLENDLLVVHGKSSQIKEINTFRIFDRWGELLYEDNHFSVNDTSRGWDGRFRGQDSDPGVYVWYLEAEYIDGYIETLSGNTTLIR